MSNQYYIFFGGSLLLLGIGAISIRYITQLNLLIRKKHLKHVGFIAFLQRRNKRSKEIRQLELQITDFM